MLYYYLKDESIKGPYKIEGLIELITSDTLVREESGNWKKAKEIPEVNILLKKDGANLKTPPPISKKNKEINITPPLLKKKKNESLPADSVESNITPTKLSPDTKKNLRTPQKINKKENTNYKHRNRTTKKTDYSSNGGLSFSWLFGIAVAVGLIALASMFFNNKSSNNGVNYNTSSFKKSNSHKKTRHKADETNKNYDNSSEDESVEEKLTEDFVNTVFSYKRTCKCCDKKFSPKTNISEFDDCSDKSATVESYEFCSGKCCRKYYNGYCE